jgi:hypothetical protein
VEVVFKDEITEADRAGKETVNEALARLTPEQRKGVLGIRNGKMDKKHDYGSILNAMVEVAKERGMQNPGSDYALACYQLLETAISEAEVWGVSLADIGLKGFDTSALLKSDRKTA